VFILLGHLIKVIINVNNYGSLSLVIYLKERTIRELSSEIEHFKNIRKLDINRCISTAN
jgi:hypothetical protein